MILYKEMNEMSVLMKGPVDQTLETVPWLELRGWVYQLLMDFFRRPPRMSLIAQWRRAVELKDTVPATCGGERLKRYLESIPEEDFREACYNEMEEYERLFVGHGARMPICEGLFRVRKEGTVALSSVSNLRALYTGNGVVFNKLDGERDDHLAMELEFMAVLSEGTLSKLGLPKTCLELVESQIQFVQYHLMTWIPDFSQELAANTTSTLYLGLAELLEEFISRDLRELHAVREQLLAL